MHDLVERALEERGVDCDDRLHPGLRKPRRKRDRPLLADAHIEETVRESLCERHEPRAVRHRRHDGANARVPARKVRKRAAERAGPRIFRLPSRRRIQRMRRHSMPGDGIRLRRRIAAPLHGAEMNDAGNVPALRLSEGVHHGADLVSIHRPQVRKPQGLEERPVKGGDGGVVVEDEEQSLERTHRQKRLERHAVRERRLAHDCDHVLHAAAKIARGGHSLCGGESRAGMPAHKRVARRLLGIGEAGQAAMAAQRAERVVAPREYLPCVGLVADVPHDAVAFGIERAHEP